MASSDVSPFRLSLTLPSPAFLNRDSTGTRTLAVVCDASRDSVVRAVPESVKRATAALLSVEWLLNSISSFETLSSEGYTLSWS